MKNLPESPISLPIKTKIIFEKRNLIIDHIIVMSTDSGSKLYEFITNYYKNLGDEIKEFSNESFMCLVRNENLIEKIVKIDPESKLISVKMISGDIVYLKGDVILKSEEKKNCFTVEYDITKDQFVSYFSCENCNMNCIIHLKVGLCSECTNSCHRGHKIKLFKEKHQATWACCYCYKTKCLLTNKYNQK